MVTIDQLAETFGFQGEDKREQLISLLTRAGILPQFPLPDPPPQAGEGIKSEVVSLDLRTIQVDAKAYQFRAGGDESGVTRDHRFTCDKWDAALSNNPLLVHERLDGTRYVADGHHRLDLAKRLGRESVDAVILREADGYSVEDARIIAAYKNMARGDTDVLDAARVFKEAQSPQVHKNLLPTLDMNKGNLREALMLSTALSSGALDYAIEHRLPAETVLQVARDVPDKTNAEKSSYVEKLNAARAQENAHGVAV